MIRAPRFFSLFDSFLPMPPHAPSIILPGFDSLRKRLQDGAHHGPGGHFMKQSKATPQRMIENSRVIVTRWIFAPGEATGHHVHAHDYVVVPLTTGKLRIVAPDGVSSETELATGIPYAREAGVAHDVINGNPFEFSFVEIEIK
jgi:beta-alanine degradation protein BauB